MPFDDPLCVTTSSSPTIVSMQSHVSYGYVGNAVAGFALRRLGCEVTPLHTVMYSSHLGYEGWRGEHVQPARLRALIDGLAHIDALTRHQALLLGFLATPEHGRVAQDLRARMAPHTLLVVDPVMGDHGSLYVAESLVEFYREVLPGGVDVLVPNVFELGVLARCVVHDLSSARAALLAIEQEHHIANPKLEPLIVVKGVSEPSDEGYLYILARCGGTERIWRTAKFAQRFAGAGDLFTATLTANLMLGCVRDEAIVRAIATTSAVLEMTHEAGRAELALVSGQSAFSQTSEERMSRVERVGC